MDELKKQLATHHAGQVLEVGTGSGKFIPTLLEILSRIEQITGIDTDTDSLRKAAAAYAINDKIQFKPMNASKMEFADQTFDTVCISNALHHLPPYANVIKEMKRVVKSSGLILINELVSDDPNEAQLTHIMYHHFSADIDQRLGIYHRHTYTRQEVKDIVTCGGISIRWTYEYNEPKQDVMAEQDIRLVSEACKKHMERATAFEDYAAFAERGNSIMERLKTVGIQRPTQIMILGV
ncbi:MULTISPECIES: class I SAM-dependent methyltransferase [Paenibacillus]|uniref:Methyltransferase domain-containing protein n=1 Tax=Paenibacillus xylanilyticus TaxID=248903 RepID=A0A7Y6C3F2_9BACL|nr:class I SAM-dependent methyltransferase [Paenibacillus xylanilyticus]NUU79836.1 methyltransferase domain-containing protein [Paenibacillus xylanilyticus]